MTITASQVKELREKTGVGLMNCKEALTKANGNIEEAVNYLREKGLSSASKKASRETSEGKIYIEKNNNSTIILELTCETDFVANSQDFQNLASSLAQFLLNHDNINTIEALKESQIENKPFKDFLGEYILKLGENLDIKQFKIASPNNQIASYCHMNGKIGVLVTFNQSINPDTGKDIAMHIAATNPQYIASDDVPEKEINREKEIIKKQLSNEGKPDNIIDKIVTGKINKYIKEICLNEQAFIKDDKQSIKQILPKDTTIETIIRFSLN